MPCCGGGRSGTSRPANSSAREASGPPAIDIVYTGSSILTAIGPATGRSYRFDFTGCSRAVHPRDAPGLLAIPTLRRGA
jgi:hypothetical protein